MRVLLTVSLFVLIVVAASIADDSDPISAEGVQDHPDPLGWGFTPADEDPR